MHRLLCALILVVLSLVLPASAETRASDRVALVFGMADYQGIPALKNTINDANALADTLREIGFDVEVVLDGTREQMEDKLEGFAFRAETADLALIYFAGHGVSVQGETFLIPVDARVQAAKDIVQASVTMKDMLEALDGARKMRVLILDSCRDNPFPDVIDLRDPEVAKGLTTGAGGLVAPSPARGTLVAFAASEGAVALDGTGVNSPFNEALRRHIVEDDLEIGMMFRRVRDDVLAMTDNQQEPATYGSLSGEPFFMAKGEGDASLEGVEDLALAWSKVRPDEQAQTIKLADAGDTRSMFSAAFTMLLPESKTYDPARAAGYLQKAADAGDPQAQFELAKLYERGIGVDTDLARALALYQAAADQDYPDAVNEMGFFHFTGSLGLQKDEAKALDLFRKAADLGQTEAMFNVASYADAGLVPGLGPEDAAALLYRALRGGSARALKALEEKPEKVSAATWKALQVKLKENGLYEGKPDGQFGPGTRRSIRAAYGILEAEE